MTKIKEQRVFVTTVRNSYGDWEAVYIDREMIKNGEGHEVEKYDLFVALKERLLEYGIDLRYSEVYKDPPDKWGRYPQNLSEIN